MKKLNLMAFKIVGLFAIAGIILSSCADKRSPGRVYMPDMSYSRAYETNMPNILKDSGINYIPVPVSGTVRRGDLFPYSVPNDSTGYTMSAQVQNPLPLMDSVTRLEAQRLYMINCGICHGANMDAQGPLAGKVGGIANLKAGSNLNLSEGTMFHVTTYGKGNMGSYASQLDKRQRWMVVQYVKQEQLKSTSGKGTDSTKTAVKSTPGAPAPAPENLKSGADTAAGGKK